MADPHADAIAPAAALAPAVAILGAGLFAVLLSKFTRVSTLVYFVIAGIVLGDQGGLGLLNHDDFTVHLLAELGVVFLLFDIGLHFSIRDVKESRGDLLGLAPTQMAACTIPFFVAGLLFGLDPALALVVAAAFGLSSTAVVARLLSERNLNGCPLGRSAIAVLIFQDVVAIFLLVFAESLSDTGAGLAMLAGSALVKALLALGAAMLLARYVGKPAFQFLSAVRVEEALPIAALLVVLASAAATAWAGLSLTLGAFLAGMIVAHTPYRPLIQTEVRPFRALLLSFFFMSVGMSLDTAFLLREWPLVVALAVGLLVVKSVLILLAALVNRWSLPGAVQLATLLAQGSEFALVILGIGAVVASLQPDVTALLVATAALSLAMAPLWSWGGMRLARIIATRTKPARELKRAAAPLINGADPVVVVGLNPAGRLTVDALRAHQLPVIAMETDPDLFATAMADGYDAHFGDATDFRFWETVGATEAAAVVLSQARYESARELTPVVRERFPDVVRFVAVDNVADFVRHNRLGMRAHLLADEPYGLELAADVLRHLAVDEADIHAWRKSLKAETAPEQPAETPPAEAA